MKTDQTAQMCRLFSIFTEHTDYFVEIPGFPKIQFVRLRKINIQNSDTIIFYIISYLSNAMLLKKVF